MAGADASTSQESSCSTPKWLKIYRPQRAFVSIVASNGGDGGGVEIKLIGLIAAGTVMGGAIGIGGFNYFEASAPAEQAARTRLTLCSGQVRSNCVVDGDTFWLNGQKIRIADIDTPKINPPRCAAEGERGNRAKVRLLELLNAGPFTLDTIDRDEDRYGRKLRVVTRGGRSLGDMLVSEGLARTWSGRREPWC